MEEKLKVTTTTETQLFGSAQYVLSVSIINVHNQEIVDVNVEPIVIPGRLLHDSSPREVELSELESEKRNLIIEMQRQVIRAYEKHRFREMSFGEKIASSYYKVLASYMSLFVEVNRTLVPTWATEAIKITEWSDVERLERDILSSEKDEGFLKRAFLINKDKLKRCLERLEIKKTEDLRAGFGITLSPGDSVTFPFTIRAPHLFRPRTFDAQFKITFKDREQEKLSTHSHNQKLYFYSSAFAVPTGGMLGAIAGYVVKSTLLSNEQQPQQFSWLQLGGSVMLGLVAAFITARSPESKKAITVEDFVGGFIIGALAGMFSDKIISKIGSFLK